MRTKGDVKMKLHELLTTAVIAGAALVGFAAEEMAVIVYNGRLDAGQGDRPLYDRVTDKEMRFAAYDSPIAPGALWSQTKTVKVNTDGTFSVVLGDTDLALLVATGAVTHIGLKVGNAPSEISPRRALQPVARVTRAAIAESGAPGMRAGTVFAAGVGAKTVEAGRLEALGVVNAAGDADVEVKPFALQPNNVTSVQRGTRTAVLSVPPRELTLNLKTTPNGVSRGESLCKAPADGFAVIHCVSADKGRVLRIPAVVQYCREDDVIRAPSSQTGEVKVHFWNFAW